MHKYAFFCFFIIYADHPYKERPFCMLLLKEPLQLEGNFSVPLIELPGVKSSYPYPSGLEHCGFIVGETLPEFHKRYKDILTGQLDHGKYCHPSYITFDNGKTVKFYERSLQRVVELDGGEFLPVR
ncbi:MAG TPA: VOC family protein [Candidatus Saccharimonadales bacterium]|nr:VOC family protein [Candidatus Saccharimonadales bacterium]